MRWGKTLEIKVFGWKEKFKKILSKIFIAIDEYELEIVKITFSSDGFLTVEEKDLKTIFLGFKPNLINNQFQKINYLKNEFKKSFNEKERLKNDAERNANSCFAIIRSLNAFLHFQKERK